MSQVEALKIEKEEILNRSLNGEYVWRIKDFSGYHQKMRNSHNFVIYSKGFYTSYYGYKVCLRSNIYFSEGTHNITFECSLCRINVTCYIRRRISGNICTFYERWKWWHPRLAMEGEHYNRIGPPKWRNTQVYITSVQKIFLTLKISEEIL